MPLALIKLTQNMKNVHIQKKSGSNSLKTHTENIRARRFQPSLLVCFSDFNLKSIHIFLFRFLDKMRAHEHRMAPKAYTFEPYGAR